MEVCEKVCCSLCLDTISDTNFTVIDETIGEVLNVILCQTGKRNDLKRSICVMCNTCRMKVFDAFQFKAICMDTEDCMFPYVNSGDGTPLDLIEIYLKEKGKEHLRHVLEDEKICRLCMQIYAHGFTPVKDLESDLTRNYIPEVNFNSTIEPVVCSSCLDSLNTHSRFLKDFSDLQDRTSNMSEEEKGLFFIKSEEIQIKSEEDDVGHTGEIVPSASVSTYKRDTLNYKTINKRRLKKHELRHKNIGNGQRYNCDTCNFATKYKGHFVTHQLVHKDISQVQTYKCGECSFETKYKECVKRHELRHKNVSEVPMYKCKECSFETKYQESVKRHELRHKDDSEVPVYECQTCDYETKNKWRLKSHGLRHKKKSEVPLYKCHMCSHETKHKRNLRRHLLKHKDNCEVQMYGCDACDFKSKHKYSLKQHQLRHERDMKVECE